MGQGFPQHYLPSMLSFPHLHMTGGPPRRTVGLRKGKWTPEEVKYTNRVIETFNAGTLQLPDAAQGTTLRAYLADKLGCDPMRITKKYTGAECLGKRVYHPDACKGLSESVLNDVRKEIEELEANFREKLQQSQDRNGHDDHSPDSLISTPAIDAMMRGGAPAHAVPTPWAYGQPPVPMLPMQMSMHIPYMGGSFDASENMRKAQESCMQVMYSAGMDPSAGSSYPFLQSMMPPMYNMYSNPGIPMTHVNPQVAYLMAQQRGAFPSDPAALSAQTSNRYDKSEAYSSPTLPNLNSSTQVPFQSSSSSSEKVTGNSPENVASKGTVGSTVSDDENVVADKPSRVASHKRSISNDEDAECSTRVSTEGSEEDRPDIDWVLRLKKRRVSVGDDGCEAESKDDQARKSSETEDAAAPETSVGDDLTDRDAASSLLGFFQQLHSNPNHSSIAQTLDNTPQTSRSLNSLPSAGSFMGLTGGMGLGTDNRLTAGKSLASMASYPSFSSLSHWGSMNYLPGAFP